MRCANCQKFVSQEESDPVIESHDYASNTISGECRIVLTCAECSEELKESRFEINIEVDFCNSDEKDHDVELTHDDPSSTSRIDGKGRYYRTFYGAETEFQLKCSCGKELKVKWNDEVQSSHMDDVQ